MENVKKQTFQMPHVFVVMIIMMLLVTAISFFVPSGQFERVAAEGSAVALVDPDSFHFVDKTDPIGVMDFFRSIYQGFVNGATIMGSLLLCSGSLGILTSTGTLKSAIEKLITVTKGKEMIAIVIFYTYFAGINIIGSGEGSYPFFPIVTGMILALGYDRVMGAATIMFGSTAGFASGMVNTFSTGISQQIVGLPLFSGIEYRFVCFLVLYFIGLGALFLYGSKIRKNPSASYVAEEYVKQLAEKQEIKTTDNDDFDLRKKISLVGFLALIGLVVYGCINWSWALPELSAVYLMFSMVIAVIFKINPNQYCREFVASSSRLLGAALTIGLARSVMILLNQVQIMDTLVYYMGTALRGKGAVVTLLLIYLFVTALNFLVVSASGKAVMMMPIMSPLGQMLGINQQVMVLTYQLGDGLTNNLWPGGGLVGCSLCGLDYGVWFKYSVKVFGIMMAAAFILIVIANTIGYGPF